MRHKIQQVEGRARKPLAGMQGIQWMLAEMYSRIERQGVDVSGRFSSGSKDGDWMTEAAAAKLFVACHDGGCRHGKKDPWGLWLYQRVQDRTDLPAIAERQRLRRVWK